MEAVGLMINGDDGGVWLSVEVNPVHGCMWVTGKGGVTKDGEVAYQAELVKGFDVF